MNAGGDSQRMLFLDSPEVSRARQLLSSMKEQTELFEQRAGNKRNNPGKTEEGKKKGESNSSVVSTNSKYYDSIKERRNRLEKMAAQRRAYDEEDDSCVNDDSSHSHAFIECASSGMVSPLSVPEMLPIHTFKDIPSAPSLPDIPELTQAKTSPEVKIKARRDRDSDTASTTQSSLDIFPDQSSCSDQHFHNLKSKPYCKKKRETKSPPRRSSSTDKMIAELTSFLAECNKSKSDLGTKLKNKSSEGRRRHSHSHNSRSSHESRKSTIENTRRHSDSTIHNGKRSGGNRQPQQKSQRRRSSKKHRKSQTPQNGDDLKESKSFDEARISSGRTPENELQPLDELFPSASADDVDTLQYDAEPHSPCKLKESTPTNTINSPAAQSAYEDSSRPESNVTVQPEPKAPRTSKSFTSQKVTDTSSVTASSTASSNDSNSFHVSQVEVSTVPEVDLRSENSPVLEMSFDDEKSTKLMSLEDVEKPFPLRPVSENVSAVGNHSPRSPHHSVSNSPGSFSVSNVSNSSPGSLSTPESRRAFINSLYRGDSQTPQMLDVPSLDVSNSSPKQSRVSDVRSRVGSVRDRVAQFEKNKGCRAAKAMILGKAASPIRNARPVASRAHTIDTNDTVTTTKPATSSNADDSSREILGISMVKDNERRKLLISEFQERSSAAAAATVRNTIEKSASYDNMSDDDTYKISSDEEASVDYTTSSDTSGWNSTGSNTLTLDSELDLSRRSSPKKYSPFRSRPIGTSKMNQILPLVSPDSCPDGDASLLSELDSVRYEGGDEKDLLGTSDDEDEDDITDRESISEDVTDSLSEDILSPPRIEAVRRSYNMNIENFSSLIDVSSHNTSKRRMSSKRVSFAPGESLTQMEFIYNDTDGDQSETTLEKALFMSEEESDALCTANGGLYFLALSRGPLVPEGQEEQPIKIRRGRAKQILLRWSSDFRCGTYGSHFDIACRSGCKVIDDKPGSKRHVPRGLKDEDVEKEAGYLPSKGGFYDLALSSGLTKKALHSRETYTVTTNLRAFRIRFRNEINIVPEVISDNNCGAKGTLSIFF